MALRKKKYEWRIGASALGALVTILLVLSLFQGTSFLHPSLRGAATAAAAESQSQWSGTFSWSTEDLSGAGNLYVRETMSASGSFNFTVNGNIITGSGSATIITDRTAPGECSGTASGTYTFPVNGTYDIVAPNQFELTFGTPNPPTIFMPLYPSGPGYTCVTGQHTIPVSVWPQVWDTPAVDGAMVTCGSNAPPDFPGVCGINRYVNYKITIHGSQFCASTKDQKLVFYVEKDGFPSGHGFMQFETTSGQQGYRTDLVYGHGSVSGIFNDGFTRGPGAPQHGLLEADHPWDWRIVYHVNACQYNAAADFVNSEIQNPSKYNLLTFNCVDWIKAAAAAAGLQLPSSTNFLGVSDPVTLADSMEAIGDGGAFHGGVVQKNTQGVSPRNLFDPPAPNEVLASPLDLLSYAIDNASSVAASQNISIQQIPLAPVTLAPSGLLNVTLQGNFAPNSSLAIADYGDGSPRVALTSPSQLTHVFNRSSSQGAYLVRAAVLTFGGAMYTLLLNVTVQSGAATVANVVANVPFPSATSSTSTTSSALASAENVTEIAVGGVPNGTTTSGVSTAGANSSSSYAGDSSFSFSSASSSSNSITATATYSAEIVAVVVVAVTVVAGLVFLRRRRMQ